MAKYDIPAQINAVLSMTNQTQLYYIGHSEGTLIGFAQFSQDKEFAKKVQKLQILISYYIMKYLL